MAFQHKLPVSEGKFVVCAFRGDDWGAYSFPNHLKLNPVPEDVADYRLWDSGKVRDGLLKSRTRQQLLELVEAMGISVSSGSRSKPKRDQIAQAIADRCILPNVNVGAPPEQQVDWQSFFFDENYYTILRPIIVKEFGCDDLEKMEDTFRTLVSKMFEETGCQTTYDVHRMFNMVENERSKDRTALETKKARQSVNALLKQCMDSSSSSVVPISTNNAPAREGDLPQTNEASVENEGSESDAGSDTPSLSGFLPLSYLQDGSDFDSDVDDVPEKDDGVSIEVRDNHNRPRLHLKRIGSLWNTIGNLKVMIVEEVQNLTRNAPLPSNQPSLTVLDFNLVADGIVMEDDKYIADFLNYPTERKLVVWMVLRLRGGGKRGVQNDATKQKKKEKKVETKLLVVSEGLKSSTQTADAIPYCLGVKNDAQSMINGADSNPRVTMKHLLEYNCVENLQQAFDKLDEAGETGKKVAIASHSLFGPNGNSFHKLYAELEVIWSTSRSAFQYLYEKCDFKDVRELKDMIKSVRDVKIGQSLAQAGFFKPLRVKPPRV